MKIAMKVPKSLMKYHNEMVYPVFSKFLQQFTPTISPSPPTHATSSVMRYGHTLTAVFSPRSLYRWLVPWSPDMVLFLRGWDARSQEKSTCSSTYSFIQNSTSVCAIDTKGSSSHLSPRKRVHFLLPYFAWPNHGYNNSPCTPFHKFELLFHPTSPQRWAISTSVLRLPHSDTRDVLTFLIW